MIWKGLIGFCGTLLIGDGDLTTIQGLISSIYDLTTDYGLHIASYQGNLSKLSNCTDLTSLKISSGASDSSGENGFSGNNDVLDLDDCKILKRIYLKRNLIESVEITGCEKLEEFTMFDMMRGSKSQVIDFSHNEKLNHLNLSKNYYENIDIVALANNLKPVYENDVLKKGCPLLTQLYLNQNKLSNLNGISELIMLKELYVTDNELVVLNGIENLTDLQVLDIRNNAGITSIKPILDLMENIKESDRTDKSLTVYISGCNGILNSSTDLVKAMEDKGITVIK